VTESSINEWKQSSALVRFLKSKGVDPRYVTKDTMISHSKSGEFSKWKSDHNISEEADKKDTITFDIPLIIRMLELAREDLKSDADLHRVVEKLIEIRNKGVLTMDDYDYVANIKEGFEVTDEMHDMLDEDLRKWFKQKWVRMDTKGNIKGDCAREPGEGKPKCLPMARAHALGKEGRASAAKRKRREDPNPERRGSPINVRTEEVEELNEKNKPTSPEKWARAKAAAKSKFAVYPSAYANAWAAKKYKSMGGGWRSTNEESEQVDERCWPGYRPVKGKKAYDKGSCVKEDKFQDPYAATQTVGMEIDTDSVPSRKKELSKSARIIKSIYKKKNVKEELYDHEKEKKVPSLGKKPKVSEIAGEIGKMPAAAAVMSGGTTMTGEKRDTVEIDPMMKFKVGVSDKSGQVDPTKR
jgi:hypothetical protein